jgi:hypothetical protein
LKTIRDNVKTSAKERQGSYKFKSTNHDLTKVAQNVRSKETSHIALVAESKQNKWEKSDQ